MELDFIQWAIIIFLLMLPILYELSSTFKYYAKMTLLYLIILVESTAFLFIALFRPMDVRNYSWVAWVFKSIVSSYGIKIETRGKEHLQSDKPFIVVCNHQSSIDLIPMMEIWPSRCTGLVKKELIYAGTFGIAAWLCGTIFIDRLNPDKARGTLAKTAETIKNRNVKVWIFPEGTRSRTGTMLPFKKGAFHLAVQAQVPIVPVVFSSYSEFYSKSEKRFTTGRVIVSALPPVPTEGMTSEDVTELMEKIRKEMLDLYNETSLEIAQTLLVVNLVDKLINKSRNPQTRLMYPENTVHRLLTSKKHGTKKY